MREIPRTLHIAYDCVAVVVVLLLLYCMTAKLFKVYGVTSNSFNCAALKTMLAGVLQESLFGPAMILEKMGIIKC